MIKKAVYVERAPAKINLFLDVLDRRDDGYHNIETLFQAIDLSDHLTFSISTECEEADEIDFEINIDSNSEEIKDLGLTNSVVKAVEVYFAEVPQEQVISLIKSVDISVFIDKNIPMEAGLAGGSSNAAACLRALNKFFKENFSWSLSNNELMQLALEVGSDVPFCLQALERPQIYGEGRGEKLVRKALDFDYNRFSNMIIVKPSFGVSTAEAYKLVMQNKEKRSEGFYNKFQKPVFNEHPELQEIESGLKALDCKHVLLSGSGSAIIGFLDEEQDFNHIYKSAKETFQDFEVVKARFLN